MLLVFDLKRFEEASLVILNAYRRFPGFIMTVGTWIITGFTLVSLVTVVLWYLDGWSLVRKIVEVFGVIIGLATAAYTGILLSFARGVPFWRVRMLLYFVTTPSTGIVWSGSGISLYFYAYLLLALLLPLAITYYNHKLTTAGRLKTVVYLTLLTTVLVLVGGFLLRYVVLIGGQLIY